VHNSLEVRESQRFEGHRAGIIALALSENGQNFITGSFDQSARLWDTITGGQLRVFKQLSWPGFDALSSVALTDEPARALVATRRGTVYILDSQTGNLLRRFRHPTKVPWTNLYLMMSPTAISPEGLKIVTGSMDQTVRIWDAESGEQLHAIDTSPLRITTVAFASDETKVLTGSVSGGISLWDTSAGSEIRRFQEPDYDGIKAVFSIEVSMNGRFVLAASSWPYAQLWDAESGEELYRYGSEDHGMIQSAALSPDATLIATSSIDHKVRLWDVETATEVECLDCRLGRRMPQAFLPVAFSPRGDFLITGSARNIALRFDLVQS